MIKGGENTTLNDELIKTHEELKAKGLSRTSKPAYGIEITMGSFLINIRGDPDEKTNYLHLIAPTIDFDDDEIRHNLRREIRDLILDFVMRDGKKSSSIRKDTLIHDYNEPALRS